MAWLPFANVFVIAYVLRANLLAILSGHLHSPPKKKSKSKKSCMEHTKGYEAPPKLTTAMLPIAIVHHVLNTKFWFR